MRVAIVRRERGVALSMDVCADNLVAGLKELRPEWDIIEIAPEPWSDNLEDLWHSGNPFRKYYERFWNHPRTVAQLNVDLFHIIDHTNGHVAYWLKKLGKPIVITCHDLVQYVYPEILRDQSRLPAFSMASWRYSVGGMRVADRIVAVSTNTATDVTNMLDIDPERVKVVANGVEPKFRVLPADRIETRRKQHIHSPKEICLLNVGSTHQRKNILTILRVLETLSEKGLSVRLWKVGDDFTTEQKAYIRDRQLEDKITWFKQLDRETSIELFNAADVLLAPSLYEGFGLTILEAMACGTPVITSNVSSLPEVAGDAAILLDPIDVDGMVAAVCRLQEDSGYRQGLVEKGFIRTDLFSWRKTAQKTALIYEFLGNNV